MIFSVSPDASICSNTLVNLGQSWSILVAMIYFPYAGSEKSQTYRLAAQEV